MTACPITTRITEYVANADENARQCKEVLAGVGLAAALERCRELGWAPPTCSLTAQSRNAELLRMQAARKITDPKWWAKNLRLKAMRDFEHEKMRQGLVTNYVSDEMREFYLRSHT